MTMDDIRAKTDNRKGRQCCFTEERKFLNILINLSIWTISAKIKFIIKKIKCNPLVLHLKNTDILFSPSKFQIKMCDKFHLIFVFFRNRNILRYHDTYIKFIFIKILWKRSHYISQASCFDKWYTFGCYKQYFFHTYLHSETSL